MSISLRLQKNIVKIFYNLGLRQNNVNGICHIIKQVMYTSSVIHVLGSIIENNDFKFSRNAYERLYISGVLSYKFSLL